MTATQPEDEIERAIRQIRAGLDQIDAAPLSATDQARVRLAMARCDALLIGRRTRPGQPGAEDRE